MGELMGEGGGLDVIAGPACTQLRELFAADVGNARVDLHDGDHLAGCHLKHARFALREFAQRDQAFGFRVCGVAPEAGDEQVRAVGGYVLDADGRHQAISGLAAARRAVRRAMRSAQAAEQLARTRARVSAMSRARMSAARPKRSATRAAHSPAARSRARGWEASGMMFMRHSSG